MKNNFIKLRPVFTKYIFVGVAILFLTGIAIFSSSQKQNFPSPVQNADLSQESVRSSSPRVSHVAIVVLENLRYENVIGNERDMPYLNSLASSYAYAKNYFANKHPSISNYFILTTGQTISNDNDFEDTVDADNLARILAAAGKNWKEYSESLPAAGYVGPDADFYRRHHNPFSYFSDVRNDSSQRKNLVPLEELSADIRSNNLPDFALIVPDNRNNTHNCPTGVFCTSGEKRATADQWLKKNIGPLLASPSFSQPGGGLLIITADEGSKADHSRGGGHTFWIAVGPDIKNGYASDTFFQHENTLRFVSELLGLDRFPGKAATASSMHEFLKGY